MIPQGNVRIDTDDFMQMTEEPSLTYELDFEKGMIRGKIDGLDAVRQAAYKILHTVRFEHLIYSSDYGHELNTLIGKDPLWVRSEIVRLVTEALLQDDRMTAVSDFALALSGDTAIVQCQVETLYGHFTVKKEVNSGV